MKKIVKHAIAGFLGIQLIVISGWQNNVVYAGTYTATDSDASKTETETELKYIQELEGLAEEYGLIADEKEHFSDTRKEVMVYLRSKQYKSAAWNICAGPENTGFSEYVYNNDKDIERLRTLGTFNTPYTNEKSKFVHFIGALNMAYNGYGELGSWAGDLAQMTKNLKDKNLSENEIEKVSKELLCGKSQFTKEEMIADIDAVNIAYMLDKEDIPVSQAVDEYYLALMDEDREERYRLFLKNQFELDLVSEKKLADETSRVMKEDAFIGLLFDDYGISLDDPGDIMLVDAAAGAFADYIFKHCPDDMVVDDSFFPTDTEESPENAGSGSSDSHGSSGSSGNGGEGYNSSKSSDSGPGMVVTMTGTWMKDEAGWSFINTSGKRAKESWQYLDYEGKKNWYYFGTEGYMATGWQQVGGVWYYLDASGEMLIGWQSVNGYWYYLDPSGAMLKDTVTPDGYKVGNTGRWIG